MLHCCVCYLYNLCWHKAFSYLLSTGSGKTQTCTIEHGYQRLAECQSGIVCKPHLTVWKRGDGHGPLRGATVYVEHLTLNGIECCVCLMASAFDVYFCVKAGSLVGTFFPLTWPSPSDLKTLSLRFIHFQSPLTKLGFLACCTLSWRALGDLCMKLTSSAYSKSSQICCE